MEEITMEEVRMEEITLEEMLRRTKEILRNIHVPAEYANSIAMPIWVAMNNLQECIDAFAKEGGQKDVCG